MIQNLDSLKTFSAWPEERPDYPFDDHGWFDDRHKVMLNKFINSRTRVIIEIGSWLGKSTRYMLETAPNATVICIDTWKGSKEHQGKYNLEDLKGRFEANCWEYLDRIIMLEMESILGLQTVSICNVQPDLIYIDGSHEYLDVLNDIRTSLKLFPDAQITGDDYDPAWPGVMKAIDALELNIKHIGGVWWEV